MLLHLVACVALARGAALSDVWGLSARHRRGVRRVEMDLDLERLIAHIHILAAWFARARRRPHYSRREKLLILEYVQRYALKPADIARDFFVSTATAYRGTSLRKGAWREDSLRAPICLLSCTRIADSRRDFVREMACGGFGSDRAVARHFHHHGETISPRSVGRIRAEALAPETPSPKLVPPREEFVAASDLLGPKDRSRPRVARLLRSLADVFMEGIARDTLHAIDDEDARRDDARTLLRSRRADQLAILLSRLSRIPPRKRPHYTGAERAEILAFKCRCRVPNALLAEWFLLDPGTLSAWADDVDRPEQRKQQLVPPIDDLDTAVASVAEGLPFVPRRLQAKVQETLAALAGKVPARRRRTQKAKAAPHPARAATTRNLVAIEARSPNHFWTTDLTTIELDQEFYLGTIQDLFSRHILAWDLFPRQPTSEQIRALLEAATARHGSPQHFVSNQGRQFIGEPMQTVLASSGTDHRRGAIGQHGSIAIIERTWRTLKECLALKTVRTQVPAILRERVAIVIDYYSTKRPHMALGDSTPAEVYEGRESRAESAEPAPRGWPGQDSPPIPFVIRYAFPAERRLPYLERVA